MVGAEEGGRTLPDGQGDQFLGGAPAGGPLVRVVMVATRNSAPALRLVNTALEPA